MVEETVDDTEEEGEARQADSHHGQVAELQGAEYRRRGRTWGDSLPCWGFHHCSLFSVLLDISERTGGLWCPGERGRLQLLDISERTGGLWCPGERRRLQFLDISERTGGFWCPGERRRLQLLDISEKTGGLWCPGGEQEVTTCQLTAAPTTRPR